MLKGPTKLALDRSAVGIAYERRELSNYSWKKANNHYPRLSDLAGGIPNDDDRAVFIEAALTVSDAWDRIPRGGSLSAWSQARHLPSMGFDFMKRKQSAGAGVYSELLRGC